MRIFFPSAAETLTDHAANGEGIIAWTLLCALAERKHEIVACVKRADLSRTPPFEVIEIPADNPLESLSSIAYARSVKQTLRNRGPDSFDLAHWLFPDYAPGFPLSATFGLPLIVGPIVQPWNVNQRWWPPGYALARAIRPFLRARAHKLLTGSSAVLVAEPGARPRLPSSLRHRSETLPFGLPIEKYSVSPMPAKPKVLYVGRLTQAKGISDLVAAFPAVYKNNPDCELVIVGTGPMESALRQQVCRLGIDHVTTFHGGVPHSEIPKIMAASSLVCLPSHGEPFGMVLLEAMASGRAVVATNRGGPAWIVEVGDGGRLVSPGNSQSLAKAITELLADSDRLTLGGQANRRLVQGRFGLGRVISQLEHVYTLAVSSGRRDDLLK